MAFPNREDMFAWPNDSYHDYIDILEQIYGEVKPSVNLVYDSIDVTYEVFT